MFINVYVCTDILHLHDNPQQCNCVHEAVPPRGWVWWRRGDPGISVGGGVAGRTLPDSQQHSPAYSSQHPTWNRNHVELDSNCAKWLCDRESKTSGSKNSEENDTNKCLWVCECSPAVDDRQDVWTVVPWGQNDAGVWRLEVPLRVVVVETVQAVYAVGDMWDAVALKQQLRHHLATVQRVAGRLCQHNGVCHMALQQHRDSNADWSSECHEELVWRCMWNRYV